MPHQIIEYSVNLAARIDMDALLRLLHEQAAALDMLPVGGLRTRAVARTQYRIADGHADNAFINVTLRIAAGRSLEDRQHAGETLFAALCGHLQTVSSSSPLAISFEIQEIDPVLRWKKNNLRNYLSARSGGEEAGSQ